MLKAHSREAQEPISVNEMINIMQKHRRTSRTKTTKIHLKVKIMKIVLGTQTESQKLSNIDSEYLSSIICELFLLSFSINFLRFSIWLFYFTVFPSFFMFFYVNGSSKLGYV